MFGQPNAKIKRLERKIADLESQLEAERRRLEIANAEIESLSQVIARDRQRVAAEIAMHANNRARHESNGTHEGLERR